MFTKIGFMNKDERIEKKRFRLIRTLKSETALVAYLDLANMFHWKKILGWKFRVEDIIAQLLSIESIKKVYVVGVRGQVAKELFEISDRFINFGLLYNGKKNYIAKIPPEAGPRDL